ncbi:hypothetical protein [Verrucomicrobium spinosum]|uniref:hypothetical protein n=1 Tax=Verrucomicrobium spinosum TaxID=2736 RepID=UPI00210B176A|nr:hypothetical protein [Verrucomicrobium spinosum]
MPRTASASQPPYSSAHPHAAGAQNSSWTAWRAARLTALLLALSLPACNDAGHLDTAVDALKSREKQLQAREEASLAHDRALADKERQLADTAADLAKQREEIHQLRLSLDAEISKARQQQEAALRKERRAPLPRCRRNASSSWTQALARCFLKRTLIAKPQWPAPKSCSPLCC